MKKDLLTVKELAAELRMSPKSIQRAYRKEEISCSGLAAWRGRPRKSSTGDGMQRTTPHASSQRQLDTAERDRRRHLAARTAETPPDW